MWPWSGAERYEALACFLHPISVTSTYLPRTDDLTAQHVEIGLGYQRLLTTKDAEVYMRSVHVPAHVIKRVLHTRDRRPLRTYPSPIR